MATANIIELKTCMADCLAFCDAHTEHEFVAYHHPRLLQALQKYNEAVDVSDSYYRTFMAAQYEYKKQWKAASNKLRNIQKRLETYEVSGYPADIVLYWDIPVFRSHVKEMLDWLQANLDSYPLAKEDYAELKRLCDSAEKSIEVREEALNHYSRQAQFRSGALSGLGLFLTEFRESVRRNLGEGDPTYQAIRWPFSLSPDRPVLV